MNRSLTGLTKTPLWLLPLVLVTAMQPIGLAQIKQAESSDAVVRYGPVQISEYRVGVTVRAKRGTCGQIMAMVAVPFECGEQSVELLQEDVTSHVAQLDYRLVDNVAEGGARQLIVSIPYLPAGEEARALLTFEVRTRTILPPDETASLTIPAKPDFQLKRFLGTSPLIETKHSKIKKLARVILAKLEQPDESTGEPEVTDWQRVEAIYDYVQGAIEYLEGPDKSAVNTLRDKQGDCQNISALFVALCRASKVPARIVWVHNHNYAEFCLEDAAGEQHWFPCESAGKRAFGEMPLARTILQKGDSFRVPERPRERLRYASDYLLGVPAPGSGKPSVSYIHEQL